MPPLTLMPPTPMNALSALIVPFVIDPFAFKQVDAVLATHYHQDHMSAEWAAHVLRPVFWSGCGTDVG